MFRPKNILGTNVYKDIPDFLFFGHNDVTDFLEFHLKLYIYIYIYIISTTSSFSKFWASLPLRGLRQWPNWPSGRTGPSGKFWIWATQTGIIGRTRKKVKIHPSLSLSL